MGHWLISSMFNVDALNIWEMFLCLSVAYGTYGTGVLMLAICQVGCVHRVSEKHGRQNYQLGGAIDG